MKYGTDNDPYCYSGTQILINKLEIKDEDILEEAEKEITLFSAEEIGFTPPPYDLSYWRLIHRQLFQDIYDWAGELRSVFITKSETQFCNPQYIEQEANRLLNQFAKDDFYSKFSRSQLIAKSSELFAELNLIHPFREGNGRAQRILFEHIFENCGYDIDWSGVEVEEWTKANIAGVDMNYDLLAEILNRCLSGDDES